MTKLNAYRCDRCQAWIEEPDNTAALIVLKGKTAGTFRRDLCPACVEKLELGKPDEASVTTRVLSPSRPRHKHHTPEERMALVRKGRKELENGVTLEAVVENLGIALWTWKRWNNEFASASLSASPADPDRATKGALGV